MTAFMAFVGAAVLAAALLGAFEPRDVGLVAFAGVWLIFLSVVRWAKESRP